MFMRRFLPLFSAVCLLGVVLVGCGLINPASRLFGVWKLDVEATIDRNSAGNDVQAGLARAAWGFLGGDVIVEFRPDGTGVFTGQTLAGGSTEEGTWKVVRADADLMVVEVTNKSGTTREMQLHMKGHDTFEVEGNNGNVAIFRRVKEG